MEARAEAKRMPGEDGHPTWAVCTISLRAKEVSFVLYFQLPGKKERTNDMGRYSQKQAAGAQKIEALAGD